MSKIIQALEKAKSEGGLTQTAVMLEERDTLSALEAVRQPSEAPEPSMGRRRRVRGDKGLAPVSTLAPEVLRPVDARVEALHRPMSVISEQFRMLRNRLERLNLDGHIRTLAVTSAVKGEGKSLTATNLAAVMAQDATKRILLVDADLRRPHVHELFGMERGPGLADFLQGTAGYEAVVRLTPWFGLSVVTAGTTDGHPAELLASAEFGEFVRRAREGFEYVIVDTPPLHPISDVRFLSETLDGVLLVVRAKRTSRNVVKHAAESLPAGKIVGTVLNRVDNLVPSFGYRYSKGEYYYRYY